MTKTRIWSQLGNDAANGQAEGLHRQPLDMLRKAGFVEVIGRKNLVAHFDDALVRANEVLTE